MIRHWLSTPATLAIHWDSMARIAPAAFVGPFARPNEGAGGLAELPRFDWPQLCLRLMGHARIPVGRLFRQAEIEEILRAALRDERCASIGAFQGVLQRPGQVSRLSDRLKRTSAQEYAEAEAMPWFADASLELLRKVYQEKLAAAGGIDVPGLFLKFLAAAQEKPLQTAIETWREKLVDDLGPDFALIIPRADRLLEDSRKFERAVTLVLIDRFRHVHLGSHLWPDDTPERFESLTADWATLGAESQVLPPLADLPETWFIDSPARESRAGLAANGQMLFVETREPKAEIAVVADHVASMIEGGISATEIEIRTPQRGDFVDRLRETLTQAGIVVEPAGMRLVESPRVRTLLDLAEAIEEDWPAEALADLLRHPDFRRSAFAAEVTPQDTARLALQVERLGNVNGIELIRRMLLVRADEHAARTLHPKDAQGPILIAVEALTNLEKILVTPARNGVWTERVEQLWGIVEAVFEPEFTEYQPVRQFFDSLANGVGNVAAAEIAEWTWRDFLREAQLRAEARALVETGEHGQGVRIISGDFVDAGPVVHLVLAGMTEDYFPSRSRIRDALARDENVDLEAMRARELRYFREAVGGALETLWISYHQRDGRGIETDSASFLRGVPWSPAVMPVRRNSAFSTAGEPWFERFLESARRRKASTSGAYAGELANPFVLRDLGDRFGPGYLFSATSLEAVSLCPYKFFGKYVLGLGEGEIDDDLGTDYLAEGETIHAVLEDFHRAVPIAEIERLSDDEIQEKLEALVARRHPCPPRLAGSDLGRARWEVQNRRITIRLGGYAGQLRRDLEVPSRGGNSKAKTSAAALFGEDFEILQCEVRSGQSERGLNHLLVSGGPGELGGDFRIGGRIDRIDGQSAGARRKVRLLDYKTGAAIPKADTKSRLHLQLPIYAMMVQASRFGDAAYEVEDLGFWYLKAASGGYSSIRDSLSPGAPLDVELLRIQYEPFLRSLVSGIRSGRFPVRPRAAGCESRCELSELCRIRERRTRRRAQQAAAVEPSSDVN